MNKRKKQLRRAAGGQHGEGIQNVGSIFDLFVDGFIQGIQSAIRGSDEG